ncbi:glycosyltransferase [Lutibacter citreus]|uniref:glycosyltransferase n=1 Tax=Lutibacter citreus TaxID=2138210 RepID=UPI000DBE8BD0|nr:glycosyltransferase [Lutibacter citreus]
MKKVVFIIESLQCGGAEKSLITLLNLLDYSVFQVDLILFNSGGEFEKFVPKEVTIINKPLFKNVNVFNKFYKKIEFWILRKFTKNKHTAQNFWNAYQHLINTHAVYYDVAIAYNQGFATYYLATKMSASKKIAWVNTDYQKAGYNAAIDFQFYKKLNTIVAVSEECKQSLKAAFNNYNLNATIEVIPDILDTTTIKEKAGSKIENLNFDTNLINIVTVGRLAEVKGYQLAINACKILVERGFSIKWYVIGEGSEREKLEKHIKNSNLENVFNLIGYKENPYPYINTCDIYVQTSLFEGLGLTLIEASILNKPIVSTNFPTAFSILEPNKTGLIAAMDAVSIADAIQTIIENDDLKNKLIENLKKQKNTRKEESISLVNKLLLS